MTPASPPATPATRWGSRDGYGLSIGLAATARDVIELLRRTPGERGGLPLVLVTGNGGPYKSRRLARWLVRHGVVHLESLPHTPQHNAACEHGHGELKRDAELPLRRGPAAARLALERMIESATRLDGHRLRASRGWQTAETAVEGRLRQLTLTWEGA